MKYALLCLLLALSASVFAQSNFQRGYVVTNSQDTIRGYIDNKERGLNPSVINFKREKDGNSMTYILENCSAYSIDGIVAYKRFAVNISLGNEDISRLSSTADTTTIRDTVFLKVLQTGSNVALFSYKDRIKKRYYIQDKDTVEPYELIRSLFYKEGSTSTIVYDNRFARQLFLIARKFNDNETNGKILNIGFKEKELIAVVSGVNGEAPVKSKFAETRFFAGVGLNFSNASYTGQNDLANSAAKARTFCLPMITGGVDVFADPAIGRLIFRAELSALMSKGDISTTIDIPNKSALSHSFSQLVFTLTPQVMYNFYNGHRFKFFGSIGAAVNLSTYPNNKSIIINYSRNKTLIEENKVELEGFYFSGQAAIGITLDKRIEFSMGYIAPSAISSYTYYSVSMQKLKVGINYMFGKH